MTPPEVLLPAPAVPTEMLPAVVARYRPLADRVATRDELAAWAAKLDELGIQHTGIRDEQQPLAYSTVRKTRPSDRG